MGMFVLYGLCRTSEEGVPKSKNMDDDSSDKRDWDGILRFIFYDTVFYLALVWLVIHFFGME